MVEVPSMRTTLSLALTFLFVLSSSSAHAVTRTHAWSKRFGGNQNDTPNGLAIDPSGNILTAGYYRDVVNFGGSPLTSTGATDIYLAKFAADGTHLWSKSFGQGFDNDFAYSVTSDPSSNVYLTGLVGSQGVDFGGGTLAGLGNTDVFLAKFDALGNHIWSQRFGGTFSDAAIAVALDASNNVLITGYFGNTAAFGGSTLTSAGGNDIFVAKYNSGGVHQWSKRFGAVGYEQGNSVKVDAAGNVYVFGIFQNTVDFGGGGLVSAGGSDIFLMKLDPNGNYLWAKRFGSFGDDGAYRLQVESGGNIYFAGSFLGTVNFGGGALVSAGNSDAVVAKFDGNGNHIWSQRYGSGGDDYATSIAQDGAGNVYFAGLFSGTVDLGGGGTASVGGFDGFLAEVTSNGAYLWDRRAGGPGNDALVVAADASGNVFTTGSFFTTIDLGGGPLFSNSGSLDLCLGAYVNNPMISTIADVGNDQGRRVKIQFAHSTADQSNFASVVKYEAYRRSDSPPAVSTARLSQRQLLDSGWTFAGEVPAHQKNSYSIDAETIGDSTVALGQYYSVFFIRAATASTGVFFDSQPDSGYSVDNLAPGIPQNFIFNAGQLTWNESTAKDFKYFTVYGSNTSAFGSATKVDYSVAPSMNVNTSSYVFYFVTATDFSGNEGKPAIINTLSGVSGTPRQFSLSLAAFPNPFNPATTLHYSLPSRERVRIDIFDSHGARVTTLVDSEKPAGEYSVAWRGLNASGGTVGSGIYFARLTSASGTRSYKLTLLK
jgi:FlgD Ig-like domain/Beta-propeller repeat